MNEVYDKAVEAIAEVAKFEEAQQTEPSMTVTMSLSTGLMTWLAVQLGIKSIEERVNSELRRNSLPSQYDRQELARLRDAFALLEAAMKKASESSEGTVK